MVFNIFRRKKEPTATQPRTAAPTPPAPGAETPASESKQEPAVLPRLVQKPHQTEKATALRGGADDRREDAAAAQTYNQHVFRVERRANKTELRKAIERHYGVHVQKLRVLNAAAKPRRVKGRPGWKPGFKKAIVSVRAGEKIDINA